MTMKELIDQLPEHLRHALNIFDETGLQRPDKRFEHVVICGLGGSGIGASIVAEMLRDKVYIPIVVNKDYQIPAFVNNNTLLIACSYSGNTEETLAAAEEAYERGAHILVISSGGKLIDIAINRAWPHLIIPSGNPPRSMLGYSLVMLSATFDFYGLAETNVVRWVEEASELLKEEHEQLEKKAKELVTVLKKKIVAIYACEGMSALAERVRQQLNENSKMLGWNAAIPEMNHNELVGWHFKHEEIAVIFLRSPFEHPRNAIRARLNKDILIKKTPHVIELFAKGSTPEVAALYLIHLTDLLSHELSIVHGVDIMDIEVINYLKGELAKQ